MGGGKAQHMSHNPLYTPSFTEFRLWLIYGLARCPSALCEITRRDPVVCFIGV